MTITAILVLSPQLISRPPRLPLLLSNSLRMPHGGFRSKPTSWLKTYFLTHKGTTLLCQYEDKHAQCASPPLHLLTQMEIVTVSLRLYLTSKPSLRIDIPKDGHQVHLTILHQLFKLLSAFLNLSHIKNRWTTFNSIKPFYRNLFLITLLCCGCLERHITE